MGADHASQDKIQLGKDGAALHNSAAETDNATQAPFPSSSGYKTTIHSVKPLANALASRHCMHMTCCSELNDI